MRDPHAWRASLVAQLRRMQPDGAAGRGAGFLLDVELGLHLLQRLAPDQPALSLWPLLTGYPFHPRGREGWREDERHRIGAARQLLLHFKNRHEWGRALEEYAGLPDHVRGFDLDAADGRAVRREPALLAGRWEVYEAALGSPAPYRKDRVRPAGPGTYLVHARRRPVGITIPADLPLPPIPAAHPLGPTPRRPVRAPWSELLATAKWMDDTEACAGSPAPSVTWWQRLQGVRLELLDENRSGFAEADTLEIAGCLHVVGMVGAGKSTLMDVLAVWAARNGLRTTLVVGDVVGALRRVALFRRLGLAAAPVLGSANRARHMERLHRMHAQRGVSALAQHDPSFEFLSTACALDGLRTANTPLALDEAPCRALVPLAEEEDSLGAPEAAEVTNTPPGRRAAGVPAETPARHPAVDAEEDVDGATGAAPLGCPLWGGCQRHRAARELVDALIWVATPASLVYTRVPQEINQERLRYAELVYRRSDLVVFDEADQVQTQLDAMFSPGQTLVGRAPDSWLDNVLQWKDQELTRGGRGQLAERGVGTWNVAGDAARTATNRLYTLLRQVPALKQWVERDYFTEWTLTERLARAWSGVTVGEASDHPVYQRLRRAFDAYLADPLGDRGEAAQDPVAAELAALTQEALPSANEATIRRRIRSWLVAQNDLALDDKTLEQAVVQLEFTMLLAVLSDRLDALIRSWKQVEAPLNLEGSSPLLFHRPPEDYMPVIPESPMGNVLGYQYHESPDDPDHMGELRFFRCAGVGRWLLLHFHELFAADGNTGPSVLLLSGTSWAGTSPRYHVQVPVRGVLRAPEEEVAAVARSTFAFTPLFNADQQPLRVSGRRAGDRAAALQEMLVQLARAGRLPGAPSRLELERARLPEGRRRILLLVGSYQEARDAAAALVRLREDWRGQVRYLVADDDEFETGWGDAAPPVLRRGEVDRLADTGAWLLIAPLLAVERGHNILNDVGVAAIGAAYFLVRPHPRPDDISHAIQAMNHWAVERVRTGDLVSLAGAGADTLDALGRRFRSAAYVRWRHLLHLPLVFSTLPAAERDALTWSQLVSIWQVIGRLVRGGCDARVYFCDAAFARRTSTGEDEGDTPATSLLVSMRRVLQPFFEAEARHMPPDTVQLVQILYGPFYDALTRMQGVADAEPL